MLIYILKRILFFIPTFFIISLFTFMLSQMAPGDPIEDKLNKGKGAEGQIAEKLAGEQAYIDLNEKYGRNLPAFYFTITSKSYPDTLYKFYRKNQRENLERLIDKYGNWAQIDQYYKSIKRLEYALINLPMDTLDPNSFERNTAVREACATLYINYEDSAVAYALNQARDAIKKTSQIAVDSTTTRSYNALAALQGPLDSLLTAYANMQQTAAPGAKYVPTMHWYGVRNQYHRWMFGDVPWIGTNNDPTRTCRGFLRGDFGISYLDNRPVSSIIGDAIKWTLLINLITTLITYFTGVYLGVQLAIKRNTFYDRALTTYLFIQYSIPIIWLGTLLIIFFTNDYYASWMNIFPPYGLGKIGPEYGFWEAFWDRCYHLILPVFCLTFGTFAYISRQMRGSMLAVIRQDYIRTAFAKGLPPKSVYWRHAFRNSLIPIITIFSSLLPAMIAGSVIIEFLFTIPGMGRLSYESVNTRNFPLLFTILMFSAILTMLGNLLADVLYAATDPRISFTKKEG